MCWTRGLVHRGGSPASQPWDSARAQFGMSGRSLLELASWCLSSERGWQKEGAEREFNSVTNALVLSTGELFLLNLSARGHGKAPSLPTLGWRTRALTGFGGLALLDPSPPCPLCWLCGRPSANWLSPK